MPELRGIQGNPRTWFSNHRERGMARYSYTVADVASLAGLSPKTLHNVARRRGLDLRDLGSVVAFVTRRRAPHSRVRRWAQDAADRDLDRCVTCGAGVGRQCSQPSGKVRAPHRGRKARTP